MPGIQPSGRSFPVLERKDPDSHQSLRDTSFTDRHLKTLKPECSTEMSGGSSTIPWHSWKWILPRLEYGHHRTQLLWSYLRNFLADCSHFCTDRQKLVSRCGKNKDIGSTPEWSTPECTHVYICGGAENYNYQLQARSHIWSHLDELRTFRRETLQRRHWVNGGTISALVQRSCRQHNDLLHNYQCNTTTTTNKQSELYTTFLIFYADWQPGSCYGQTLLLQYFRRYKWISLDKSWSTTMAEAHVYFNCRAHTPHDASHYAYSYNFLSWITLRQYTAVAHFK